MVPIVTGSPNLLTTYDLSEGQDLLFAINNKEREIFVVFC